MLLYSQEQEEVYLKAVAHYGLVGVEEKLDAASRGGDGWRHLFPAHLFSPHPLRGPGCLAHLRVEHLNNIET